ncbi:MAG: hypothetical protein GYA69_05260, partial [Candidatus Moranbacteria bacterium]|nr:hypothetical protein [Candidatus Moranbacteria bacterium]
MSQVVINVEDLSPVKKKVSLEMPWDDVKNELDAVKATIAITVFTAVTYVPVYALLLVFGVIKSHLGTAPWGEMVFQAVYQG